MVDLGTLGGNDSDARDINELGHVVGYADDEEEKTKAFAWRDGQMVNLGTLPSSFSTFSYSILWC